jgi:adenylate cyclase
MDKDESINENNGYTPMQLDRHSLAVMLADVVGSTPLYEREGDAAALQQILECLDTIRQIAIHNQGDFIRSRGDDVLCVFANPTAALAAVTQIQRQLTNQSLAIRIGLHFGPVIVARDEAFGDVVNVTARLAATANPGEVLIGQSLFEALPIGSRGKLRRLDMMTFKGKQEGFDVYTLASDDLSLYTEFLASRPVVPESSETQQGINLLVHFKDQVKFCRGKECLTIGRSSDCDIVLQRPWVSRHHATLVISNGRARLSERSSSGTYISTGSDLEVFVRREDVLLFGSGVISPGRRSSMDDAQILNYEVTTD